MLSECDKTRREGQQKAANAIIWADLEYPSTLTLLVLQTDLIFDFNETFLSNSHIVSIFKPFHSVHYITLDIKLIYFSLLQWAKKL